ncbi:MAG: hypothetical protein LRY56_01585 [Burkholderiaceae bacterium]|nr:hypothetical protein [Burkholderiaceae bacterium]
MSDKSKTNKITEKTNERAATDPNNDFSDNPFTTISKVVESKQDLGWFIADANVIIDYVTTSPGIISLVAKHIGPIFVEAAVLDEVTLLNKAQSEKLGLTVVQANLAQLSEASERGGPLSFEDKLCLVLARQNGWVCLSNDGPLRRACKAQGVMVVWGLEIMLNLVGRNLLAADRAIEVAWAIHAMNPVYISRGIVGRFAQKVHELSGVDAAKGCT